MLLITLINHLCPNVTVLVNNVFLHDFFHLKMTAAIEGSISVKQLVYLK